MSPFTVTFSMTIGGRGLRVIVLSFLVTSNAPAEMAATRVSPATIWSILMSHSGCRQSHQCLSTARGGDEFHFDGIDRVDLHHGANVPGFQPVARHVDLQYHCIEFMKTHELVL